MTPALPSPPSRPLLAALERAHAVGPAGAVVFDLDSTLLDNRPRQARILREFGAAHDLRPLLGARPEHWQGWSIVIAMQNAGLAPGEAERWAPAAKEFWRERFFTSEYCAIDDAIAGAPDYVLKIASTGAQLAYCTGRHEAMREGTVASFRRLGFPLPGAGCHLLMKPSLEESDDDWKATAHQRLRDLGRVVAVFDNEPLHLNGYFAAFPDALVVQVETDHSGRPVQITPGIQAIRDFRERRA